MPIFGVIILFVGSFMLVSKDKEAQNIPVGAKLGVILIGALLTVSPFVHMI